MKAIRNIVNGNKGFVTFWLVLLFLNAALTRSVLFASGSGPDSKIETTHHDSGSKYDLAAISDDDSGLNFPGQFKKDTDSDDVEFVFFGNYSPKPQIHRLAKQGFSETGLYHEGYKVPLYDLFCNWKFHLS